MRPVLGFAIRTFLAALLALGLGSAAGAVPQFPNVVYAIVDGQLLTGVSDPSKVDDQRMVRMAAPGAYGIACAVAYQYIHGGQAFFSCSDGARFMVRYQGFTDRSGSGARAWAGRPSASVMAWRRRTR